MADIRINALATTAASTASDDYVAIDGSANGTRKLNAYSPTFGGNLTVSGTGSFAGSVSLAKALPTDFGAFSVSNDLGSSATKLEAGVSGSSRGGTYFGQSEANSSIIFSNGTSSNGLLIGSFNAKQVVIGTNNTAAISINGTTQATTLSGNLTVSGTGNSSVAGTLLVATTTNSGNGKLQLADHTTSAGGIGLGTNLSIYRSSDNSAWVDALSGNAQFILGRAGTANLAVLSDGSNVYASAVQAGMGLIFRTNGSTTALTLDSSQRMLTASAAKIGSTSGTVDSRLHVYESTTVSNSNGLTLEQASTGDSLLSFLLTGVQRWSVGIDNSDSDKFKIGTGDLGAADKFTVDTSGNATVAGSIAIGNTVQTAAAVVSTHKVTISIGGSTYYLLATNV